MFLLINLSACSSVTWQGRSQKCVSEVDKSGGLGTENPQRGQGQSPGGGLGAKPPEAEDIYAKKPLQ